MTDRTRTGIRRAAVAVLLFLLAASLLIYLMLPVFERKKAKEIFGRDDVIVGDSFHQPWFYVTEEGVLRITDWLGKQEKLVLPEYFNGVGVQRLRYVGERVAKYVKEVRIPTGISFELREFRNLERLILEEGHEGISLFKLKDCPNIKEIYLPNTLRQIASSILNNAEQYPDLTIYYAGTEEEWLALGSVAKRATQVYHVVYETPVPPR